MEIPNPRIDDKRHLFNPKRYVRNVYLALLRELPPGLGGCLGPAFLSLPPWANPWRSANSSESLWAGQGWSPIAYNEEVLGISRSSCRHMARFMAYANRNFYRNMGLRIRRPGKVPGASRDCCPGYTGCRTRGFSYSKPRPDRPAILRRELERHHPTLPKLAIGW